MGQKVDIRQYIKDLKKANRDAIKTFEKEIIEIAKLDMIAVIAARVRNTGQKATGGKFKPYSTKPTLIGASSFTTKRAANIALGSKSKRRKLEWVTFKGHALAVLEGGYKEIRNIEGRETAFKDFERRGEMWRRFGIISKEKSKTHVKITFGGRSESSAKKMADNSEREGISIIDISSKEEKKILKNLETMQFNYLQQRL